jgi:hypothetical protein
MRELYKNPHTFDMNQYFSGETFAIGGRDFEGEEQGKINKNYKKHSLSDKRDSKKLDWSFLYKKASKATSAS